MGCRLVLLAFVCSTWAADAPLDLLEAARRGKDKEIAALLAKGADIEAKDKDGRTPLMLAAQYGRTSAARLLLDKGAKADARDTHRWNAYMLALLSPSGGVLRGTHDAVLKLLPQPKRFRVAITASWTPGKALFSSCFMSPEEMTQHMREVHPDGIVIAAVQHFAASNGRDLIAIVSADARGNSEISEKPTAKDVDAILTLQVEPGISCVRQLDQLSLFIQATLNAATDSAAGSTGEDPLLERVFGTGVKTGMRGWAATNPNQHGPLYEFWAKSQAGPIYWAVLTALLSD